MLPQQRREHPVLRFTPYSWAKLLWFRDAGETEIGGFGVTAEHDPMLVIDFVTVKQQVSIASVAFDDQAVADFFDQQVDLGHQPGSFARLWMHTHPGNSAHPSATDEETFERCFCSCDWSVMFILAKGGNTYARLRFGVGPGGQMNIPVEVDYSQPFAGVDGEIVEAWRSEYEANVQPQRQPWQSGQLDDPMEALASDSGFAPYLDDYEINPDLLHELDEQTDWEMRMEQLESMGMA